MASKRHGNKQYAEQLGHVCGPGGLYCPCCIPMHIRHYKVYMRRSYRRKSKMDLKNCQFDD
jgi:hypothetical protein